MDTMELPPYREASRSAVVPEWVNIPPPCYSKPPSYKETASADEQRCSYPSSDLESGVTTEPHLTERNCLFKFWKGLKQIILGIGALIFCLLRCLWRMFISIPKGLWSILQKWSRVPSPFKVLIQIFLVITAAVLVIALPIVLTKKPEHGGTAKATGGNTTIEKPPHVAPPVQTVQVPVNTYSLSFWDILGLLLPWNW